MFGKFGEFVPKIIASPLPIKRASLKYHHVISRGLGHSQSSDVPRNSISSFTIILHFWAKSYKNSNDDIFHCQELFNNRRLQLQDNFWIFWLAYLCLQDGTESESRIIAWNYPFVRLRYFWKKCENDIRFEKAEKFVNSIRRFSTSTSFQQTAESNNEPVKTKKRSFFGKKKLGKLVISNWAKVNWNRVKKVRHGLTSAQQAIFGGAEVNIWTELGAAVKGPSSRVSKN